MPSFASSSILCIVLLLSLLHECESNATKLRLLGQKRHGRPSYKKQQHADIATEVGAVADAFAPLIQEGNDEKCQDINIPQLLKACQTFQTQMERVGQARTSKDLFANIHKVQVLYQTAPLDQRDSMTRLLQYERSLNIHPPPGSRVLRDPSGAIGLLWIRRSIAFQTNWYRQVLADAKVDVTHAAKEAYRKELQPFHGYLLQNIFLGVGIPAMTPPRNQLLARLGGFVEENMTVAQQRATEKDLQRLVNVWDPLVTKWTSIMRTMDMEDWRKI
ncbi:hypothetical protein MPSEU_000447900 [Mayamaea pseudoterrestris]|nr:hypothetical protein MPSEU_000447900 [Mayamaea pseudoterrestris]